MVRAVAAAPAAQVPAILAPKAAMALSDWHLPTPCNPRERNLREGNPRLPRHLKR